jgi:hypothetical protein
MPAKVLTPVPADTGLPVERLALLGKFAVPYGGLTVIGPMRRIVTLAVTRSSPCST